MFKDTYSGKRVLVTGHTGFKGSWLTLWLRRLGANVTGVALDPTSSPSHWNLLSMDGVVDRRLDLRDAAALSAALASAEPEIVFHLAAQPLVRRSYRDPVETYSTNVMGVVNLFEAVRATPSVRVLVNATTDKVYAERPVTRGYSETDPLGGYDPYSTSKVCAEFITDSYRKSYFAEGPLIATARAGNVIGGGDWSEDRLIPDIVRACVSGQPMSVRNPSAIRPWQHVLDPLSGYLSLAQRLWDGDSAVVAPAWNFGPGHDADLSVGSLVERVHARWPAFRFEVSRDAHPHEAAILRLDSSLSHSVLGWSSVWTSKTAIDRTVAWYVDWQDHGKVSSESDLDDFVRDASDTGAAWVS